MSSSEKKSAFIEALTENQGSLHGYIFSLVRDHHAASDILQECNLVLWDKIDDFREGAPFLPWAYAIARYQVKAYLRDHKRRRELLLDTDTVELLAADAEDQLSEYPRFERALEICQKKLPEKQRSLLKSRYFHRTGIRELAEDLGRRESAVKVQLFRIRNALRDCIQRELRSEEGGA